MKKIIFLTILIILLLFSSLFIFNKKNVSSDVKTIVFWTLQLGTFSDYINGIISDFEKENPNIKIKWVDVPYSEGEKRTLASVLTDNPPDLVNLTPDFSLLLAQKNALLTFEEDDLKQFLPSLLSALKFDGKYFGIPFYATSPVTLYNKSLYKGIIPKTYDDLFKIKSNKNYLTMINFCENDTLLKLLNKYGINSSYTINSEKSIKLYTIFKQLYDNRKLPIESVTQSHRDSLEKYMSNQLMFLVTGANFINMIKENALDVYNNTDVLPQLVGDTNKYDYSLMNFIIPKKAKNKEVALKFALYFTNDENQLNFAKLTTILPVNKQTLKSDYFTTNNDNSLQTKARIISAKQLNNIQEPITNIKNKKELNTLSSNYVQQILINNADIRKTLDEFSQNWQKL